MASTLDKIRRAAAPHGLNLVAATPVARYDAAVKEISRASCDRSRGAIDRRHRQRRRRTVDRAQGARIAQSRMVESRKSARRLHPRSGRARPRCPHSRNGPAMHHRLPLHEQRPHPQLHRARQSRGHRRAEHPRRHGASCIWSLDRISRRTAARRRASIRRAKHSASIRARNARRAPASQPARPTRSASNRDGTSRNA